MRRREFIAGFAGALVGPMRVARAQEGARRIGVLMPQQPQDILGRARASAFVQALAELGWREGENLRIDWRWAGGEPALFEKYSAELVSLNADVLIPGGTAAVEAMRRKTNTLPMVFAVVSDPVGQSFVSSLAHPGGNITGFTDFDPPMATKWLAILSQVSPRVSRVAVLFNPTTAPFAELMLQAIEEAARSFAMAAHPARCQGDREIETLISELGHEGQGGVLVMPDAFTVAHRSAIVLAAAKAQVSAIYWNRSFVMDGGLMSFGIDISDAYRRAAAYVDRILKGEKVADLPVQMPAKFDFVINLKAAKAINVTIGSSLLVTADEVIE